MAPLCVKTLFCYGANVVSGSGLWLHRRAGEARWSGLFIWADLVDNLEVVADRLGIPINDHTRSHGDGTRRGWRTVSGPDHRPFFIDYPNNGNRKLASGTVTTAVCSSSASTSAQVPPLAVLGRDPLQGSSGGNSPKQGIGAAQPFRS